MQVGWTERRVLLSPTFLVVGGHRIEIEHAHRSRAAGLRAGYADSTRRGEKWARTGSLGRVRTAIEIPDAIGVEASDVRERARGPTDNGIAFRALSVLDCCQCVVSRSPPEEALRQSRGPTKA